ncbi:MAG: preprotein translocase subunit SecE [Eggerthellaceae bacterium]|jgi:preprotein translocase subunit SecE
MAKKSKTQRAKASAARKARKERARELEEQQEQAAATQVAEEKPAEEKKHHLLKRSSKQGEEDAQSSSAKTAKSSKETPRREDKKMAKPVNKKPNWFQRRANFIREVRAEMKRVTWPTRQEVIRWTGVVVVALLFFGIYVAVLDNLIITPLLVAVTGLGA